jgi:hypothetical protein
MNKRTASKQNKSSRSVNPQQTSGQAGENARDVHPKGAMREPAQTPGSRKAEGELREEREALQEVEEKVGDWSKGG